MAYLSEISYGGLAGGDFVEVAVAAGTDVSGWSVALYNNGGNVKDTASFATPAATVGDEDVYVFDAAAGLGAIGHMDGLALVDDAGTVHQFVSFQGNTITAKRGPADGETSEDIGAAAPGESLQTLDAGATYASGPPTPGTKPCFVSGTRILTPRGERPVETIAPGDTVLLACGSAAQVLLAASFRCRFLGPSDPKRPVVVPPGALGPGRPHRPLRLSPQHQLAVSRCQLSALLPSEGEASRPKVRARALVGCLGIRQVAAAGAVTYHTLLLPRHAVLVADGAEAYSLWPGPVAQRALCAGDRARLEALFPGIGRDPEGVYGPRGATIPRWQVRRAYGATAAARLGAA